MRLHELTVAAFGPFAEAQRVDFDALGEAGLFLFHGPTGAGKTTVLDAVCFALYGQVPGARQQARSLRSDHAAPGARPHVVLEATLRGRRLRVTRSPQWERPKHRGAGTTTEPARVLVEERVGDGWRAMSTRLDEAGQLLGSLLGLTMGQFCQVVLLPQGQFAEFLRADADRRRELLESLFDTERFAAVEAWLVVHRREATRALEEADQRARSLLDRVAEAAGVGAVPAELSVPAGGAWASGLAAAATTRLSAAQLAEQAARAGRDRARADAAAAVVAAAARARHAELVERLRAVERARGRRHEVEVELATARRAAPVWPLCAEVARLQTALARAEELVAELRSGQVAVLLATGTDGPTADPPGVARAVAATGSDVSLVRRRVRSVQAEIGRLGRLVEDETECARLAAEADALERDVVALDAQRAAVARWLDGATARRQGLVDARDQAGAAAGALAAAGSELRQAQDRLAAAEERDRLAALGHELRARLSARVDEAQSARQTWQDLREARLDGMAAQLAAGLSDGCPCPVCGSAEHPRPAEARTDAVTGEHEAAAEAAAARAEASRTAVAEEVSRLEVALAESRVRAGGEVDVARLSDLAAELGARLAGLTATAAGLADRERAVADFDVEHEQQVARQVGLAQESHSLRARVRGHREQVDRLRAAVDAARGGDPTVRARAERLGHLAADGERLAEAIDDLVRLQQQVDLARDRALAAARAGGLVDLAAVATAVRDDARRQELEDYCRGHDSELATVREQLADPQLAAAVAGAAPDVAATAAAAAEQDERHLAAAAAVETADRCVLALTRLVRELADVLAERVPLARRHGTVDRLSRLAEGKSADNRLRMSLSAYVLAARLEQVAAAAGDRLERMSSGRFRLVHAAETSRGRGGLQLRVTDAWTGVERDPATLSGGESFTASLALALGLADVVTAEAGGSTLETLFVDEGFGSLDDETLDDVMGVLDGLRDGGRVVGVVSHVADLRQRIPVQLRVRKDRTGSTVLQ